MSAKSLFTKPKDVRYVDMCIYIDTHIYDDSPDYETIYKYMYLLSFMLACKKQYFSTTRDYEEFASFLAYSAFQRMTDPLKSRVKSVLNYMNSIIYFRKAAFESQRHQEIIDPAYNGEWDSYAYKCKMREALEASNRVLIESSINELIGSVPSIIDYNIPLVYKLDKAIYKNIYKSCMLSMMNRFSLPSDSETKLQSRLATPSFDEVKYYRKHVSESIILWHLKDEMRPVVAIILNKVYNYLIDEIKCLLNSDKLSDDEIDWMTSSYGGVAFETNS